MKNRIIVYSIFLVVLLLICIHVYHYHKEYEPYITIFASVSSIVGVLISIIEVLNVRKTTEAVSLSLEETKKEINDFLYFSEINEMTRLIDEIEAFLNDDHFESAWLKLKELKSNLDKQTDYISKAYKEYDYPKRINNHKTHLTMDINNIFNNIGNNSIPLNKSVVIEHLDKIKECLHEMSGTIKSNKI